MIIALLAACATSPKSSDYSSATPDRTPLSQRKITTTVFTNQPAGRSQSAPAQNATANQPATQTPPPRARVVPLSARIASVNDKLRFVVVDFSNSRRPAIDERLSVYRVGEKVAEIKISGPYRNTTVAADIVAGEVKYGDEVKTQ